MPESNEGSDTSLSPAADTRGTADVAGQTTSLGNVRIFPCEQCGADLKFHIGQQRMTCEFCGFSRAIELQTDAGIHEQDFEAMLARLKRQREEGQPEEVAGVFEVRCESCSGTVVFTGTLTSSACPYCGSPMQREHVHSFTRRIPVDGVLPFCIEHDDAHRRLQLWVRSALVCTKRFPAPSQ